MSTICPAQARPPHVGPAHCPRLSRSSGHSRLLPDLLALLRPGGMFYFTINFDGLTALEPQVDPDLDERVIRLYHQTMDERRVDGRPAGGRRAGGGSP